MEFSSETLCFSNMFHENVPKRLENVRKYAAQNLSPDCFRLFPTVFDCFILILFYFGIFPDFLFLFDLISRGLLFSTCLPILPYSS